MTNYKIILIASICCIVSTSAIPLTTFGKAPLSNEGLEYLLRTAGSSFRPPQIIPDIPHTVLRPDTSLRAPVQESYDFYLPIDEDYVEYNSEQLDKKAESLRHMSPPEISNEPNYYAAKPKKLPKKYSSAIKQVHIKPSKENDAKDGTTDKDPASQERKIFYDDYYYGPVNTYQVPDVSSQENGNNEKEIQPRISSSSEYNTGELALGLVPPKESNERIDYQIHGYDGPKSYKFGYDTGKGKDRQFRFEERNQDGHVKGQYGYLDKRGKMIVVKYTSSPEKGFQMETMH